MTTIKEPNTAGWERDVAKHGMRFLCDTGYHPLLTIPHNAPQAKFEKIKGKAPGYMKRDGLWAPAAKWQDASVKPNAVDAFADIGRKTRYVPNIGVLCGLPVEIDGEHVGYLTALDVDTSCPHVLTTFSELFGYSNPVRRGRRGGTFLCITDQRESKDFKRSPDAEGYIDDGEDENAVQFISGDKQTVVFGVHPKTSKRFQWETAPMDGEASNVPMLPIAALPVISTAKLEEVLSSLGFERGKGSKATSPEERTALSKRERAIEADLNKTAPKDFEEVDEELGLTAIIESDAALKRKLNRDYSEVKDHSTHDLEVCIMFRRQLGDKFDHHAARAVLAHFPSCSEEEKQTAHHIARIMAKAEQVKTFEERGREAFGAVEDESEDDAGVPAEHLRMQANIARKAEREAAEREAEVETVKLKAEIAELDKSGAKTKDSKTESPKTKFLRSMDIFENFTVPDELIEGLLPAVGTACIVADSNVGKTFFAIHMLDTIMRGDKFFGRNTERGGVLMVAGEGRSGLNKRLAALHEVRKYTAGRGIGISYELPEFSNESSIKVEILKLEKLIKSYGAETGETTRIVVLDNLIAMVGGGDINTSKDTRPLFRALGDLAERLRICILVIHHENRSGSTAGSFAIRASADIMLHITEDKNGARTVSGDKDRDNPKAHKMQFRLKSVKVGVNKWGSDVTSCVVVPALSGEAMGEVEDGEEAPPLKVSDDPDDRLNRLVEAARDCAEKAAAHGEDADMVELTPKEIGIVFNTHREHYCGLNGKPLAPLNREGVNRIIARALEAKRLSLRKGKYRLVE
jgi:KaiC/GvpD/RAD55 family RecA-like ATPase